MMKHDIETVVIGSGPSGVSVSFPLVEAGRQVMMIDAGKGPRLELPKDDYLSSRKNDYEQWRWMIGEDFNAIKMRDSVSPKMRAPTQAFSFAGFSEANRILSKDFVALGSLAAGGLSNSWGCGVSRFSDDALKTFPIAVSVMDKSYQAVTKRIGICGGGEKDDLSSYFGLDQWSTGSLEMDVLNKKMYASYKKHRKSIWNNKVIIGQARKAVLTTDKGRRKACNLSGNCLWGCSRKSLYTAADDLVSLKAKPGFSYQSGRVVEKISKIDGGWLLTMSDCSTGSIETLKAARVILAAGTLATTRLALNSIGYESERSLLSCPTAAFLLWRPAQFGQALQSGFALAQLSYTVGLEGELKAFGSTFSPIGIPMSDFIRHLPFGARGSVRLMRGILSSCIVGNLFLPGQLTNASVQLDKQGRLVVSGIYSDKVDPLMKEAKKSLRKSFLRMGAILMPSSFTVGVPGSDVHYAGTLPMSASPKPGETTKYGELFGADGLYIVDGANLPVLSEQSHTLTIMANADRIGRYLADSSAQSTVGS